MHNSAVPDSFKAKRRPVLITRARTRVRNTPAPQIVLFIARELQLGLGTHVRVQKCNVPSACVLNHCVSNVVMPAAQAAAHAMPSAEGGNRVRYSVKGD